MSFSFTTSLHRISFVAQFYKTQNSRILFRLKSSSPKVTVRPSAKSLTVLPSSTLVRTGHRQHDGAQKEHSAAALWAA